MSAIPGTAEYVASVLPDYIGGTIQDVSPFEGQNSHSMYAMQWTTADGTTPLVLRLYQGAHRDAEFRTEAGGLRDLYRLSYPVPEMFTTVEDENVLGAPFILMERLPGEPLGKVVLGQPERIPQWIEKVASLLLRLHRLDWHKAFDSEVFDFGTDPLEYADRQVKWWTRRAATVHAERAVEGFVWLRSNIYRTRRATDLSLVHRDFHPNNLMANGERVTGVLDWGELAIADPAVDVGWTRMILASELNPICADGFTTSYCRHNPEIRDTLTFWEVFAACKRLTTFAGLRCTDSGSNIDPNVEQRVHEFMCQRLTDED